MKKLALLLFAFVSITMVNAQEKKLNIIAIGAHPDDCDSKFGGTAALFAKMGHNVKFLALTSYYPLWLSDTKLSEPFENGMPI